MDNAYDKFKKLTIVALVSIDELMSTLVLKGGNAISLVYKLDTRASIDLDFSLAGDFRDFQGIRGEIEASLKRVFSGEGYHVFDLELTPRPEIVSEELEEFWGGYSLEFKIIDKTKAEQLGFNESVIRRNAEVVAEGQRRKILVDISKHEYCDAKDAQEIDDFSFFVYTPLLIVCEKIRAICQQHEEYRTIVKSSHRAERARDFFDIWVLCAEYAIDFEDVGRAELLMRVFEAKRVPLELINKLDDDREYHSQGFPSVKDTASDQRVVEEFDYYFEFTKGLCDPLKSLWNV